MLVFVCAFVLHAVIPHEHTGKLTGLAFYFHQLAESPLLLISLAFFSVIYRNAKGNYRRQFHKFSIHLTSAIYPRWLVELFRRGIIHAKVYPSY
jgi:hypothetical protein